ncbi:MAG: SDR family oxidoreductase [Myxococcaceae bacterium]
MTSPPLKIALVTGGAVRLGRAIVEHLANAGMSVALHYFGSKTAADETVRALRARSQTVTAFQADLTAPGAPEQLVREVESQLGPLSLLVNSAAMFERAPLVETQEALFDAHWALNVKAPYLLTQAAARLMVQRQTGHIVNVLDIKGAMRPFPNYSAYAATKAALAQLTQSWAVELAPHVRVNAVAPGSVLPPDAYSPQVRERLLARIPQRRFAGADAVAEAVLLLENGPKSVTGQILAVDGGESLV